MSTIQFKVITSLMVFVCIPFMLQASDCLTENDPKCLKISQINQVLSNRYQQSFLTEDETNKLLSGLHVVRFVSKDTALILDLSSDSK